jgi:cell division protein FtsW
MYATNSPDTLVAARQPRFDSLVVLIAGALMAFGVAMVYSASVTVRGAELDLRQWWNTPLRQCVFALAGFIGMLVAAHCDYRWLSWSRSRDLWRPLGLYVLAVALLVAVQVVGRRVGGIQRSLVVMTHPFRLTFQPAELAKVVLVIWLAALLTRNQDAWAGLACPELPIRNFWRGLVPAVVSSGLLIGLTGLEDFGTAALMGAIMVCMLLLGGARWWHIGLVAAAGMVGGAGLLAIEPYRLERIKTFLGFVSDRLPPPDPLGQGYQVDQALLAIGSGGWLGRGLGAGIQKYGYLPQKDNDFILATICEELGVVGGLVVIFMFLLLLWRGWRASRIAPDPFGRLLAAGVSMLIGLQAVFNVAVVTNSVPTKGISLPFVSAGGSGVLFLGIAAGLLASIGRPGASTSDWSAT